MSLTSLNVLLGILTFAILSAALPQSGSCRCNGRISEKGNGECQTTHQGSAYCYVASDTCTDQQESSQAGWFWSFEACKKGSPIESSTPQKECTCDDHTERDDQGRETGNCLTEFRGSLWCYIDSTSKCEDKKQSSKNPSFYWSRIPCQSNTDPQSVTPEERIRRRGNTTITNRVTSDMCTGDYKANGRPPSGTVCAKIDNKVCYVESGRWGNSYCYTDTGKKNWGAECVDCSARCTGDFKENGRPSSGTKCAKVDNKVCYVESGRWGKSWCYTDTDKKNWGAECVECSGVKSDRCTGNYKANGRPPSGTVCAKVDNKVCYVESGRWGESYCYTDTDKKNWGADCVECSARCGIENTNLIQVEISGGTETTPNQYPWMVRVDPPGCGGALITDKHILTAKHCVDDGHDAQPGTKVKVGVHNQNDPNDYQEATIKEVKWPDSPDHDFAMIILEQPVDLNDRKIGTVCLPPSENEDYRGEKTLAMGWGWTPVTNDQSQFLQHLEVDVAQRQETNWLYTIVPFNNGIPLDVCNGDSGGPLVHKEDGRWTIIGTVNSGKLCNNLQQDGRTGKWNKVTDHLAWINSIIGN